MKELSDAIQAILVILTTQVGLFILAHAWIKNRGMNKKQQETLKEILSDVRDLKGEDKRTDSKIEKIEERLNDVINFIMTSKK